MALNSSREQARAEDAKSESLSDVNHQTFKILANSEEMGAVMSQAGERMVVSNCDQENSRRSVANRKRSPAQRVMPIRRRLTKYAR